MAHRLHLSGHSAGRACDMLTPGSLSEVGDLTPARCMVLQVADHGK